MTVRVIVAGDSFLAYQVAHQLNRRLGNLVHISLKYLTSSESAVYPHQATVFGKLETIDKRAALPNTHLIFDQIKSVNLNTHTVTMVGGVEDYDFLILDRQPGYTLNFWKDLRVQLTTLIAQISAQENLGQEKAAQVTVTGQTLESVQLALAIKRDLLSHHRKNIIVRLLESDPSLHDFLALNGIVTKHNPSDSKLPGLTVAPAKHLISGDVIKGAKLAHDGSVITDVNWLYGNPPHHIIIPSTLALTHNMISTNGLLARQIANNLNLLINNNTVKPEGYQTESAIYLQGVFNPYLQLDTWQSQRLRAQIASVTEKIAWEKLQNFSR